MLPPLCSSVRDISPADLAVMALPFDMGAHYEHLTWRLAMPNGRRHAEAAGQAASEIGLWPHEHALTPPAIQLRLPTDFGSRVHLGCATPQPPSPQPDWENAISLFAA